MTKLEEKIRAKSFVVTTELTPPKGTDLSELVARAEALKGYADAINHVAPRTFAEEARRSGALLVHYSTDYVFDGETRAPYKEDDATHPINVYGRTKLEGEQAIRASGCRHWILRSGWVYAARGNNFLRTMLRLAAERSELGVVGDQTGSPTAAPELARATATLLRQGAPANEVFHLSAGGETTWHEFACEIFALTGRENIRVRRITTDQYPTAAKRPRYSVLSNEKIRNAAGIVLPDWRVSLEAVCRSLG